MFTYTGGTLTDSSTIGYIFVLNKFSDLGMLYSYNSQLNIVLFFLFNISLILVGLSLILFVQVLFEKLSQMREDSKSLKLGKRAGFIAGIAFAGVGDIPHNIFLIMHHITQYFGFLAVFIMCVIITSCASKNTLPKKIWVPFLLCALCQFLYLLILFQIIPTSRLIDCVAQKFILYAQLLVFGIDSILILKSNPLNSIKINTTP
jgi:hypothetical membrane protein